MMQEMQKVAEEVGIPYIIPAGGSNEIGATGYVACAQEILTQTFEKGVALDYVVCPSGSAGTHAGLVTGFHGNSSNIPVLGINVSRKKKSKKRWFTTLLKKPHHTSALHMLFLLRL